MVTCLHGGDMHDDPITAEHNSGEIGTRSHHVRDSGSGRLEVRCPMCHAPTDVAVDTSLTDLTCSACGSHFSLVDQSQATRMAPSLTKLGRFDLVERLGVGGFGSVWKARDKELDRTVAIKIPRAGGMTSDEQEKFFREARAAAQLRHPNIVSVHEVGRDGESVYIVSDFVRGVTLGDWLTGQRLTGREAAELCAKIADALHHAHEHGVVHRDLKPANIMIDGDGQPHLMDFGLARREAGEVTVTMDGHVLGTPAYMSPEQAEGKAHQADRRSDVYSLGVILFQLLTGELPFRGNARMLLHQVIHDEPPSPRKLNGNIPKDLETISLKCLEKDPSRRYQFACEVVEELHRFLAGEPIHARPISRTERVWRWAKRNPATTLLTAAFLTALIAGAAISSLLAVRSSNNARLFREQRDLAEKNLSMAQSAVDNYLTRIADDTRLQQGDFNQLRTELFKTAVPFYEQFADQNPSDARSEANRARAYSRLASIHEATGHPGRSATEYEQAIEIQTDLVAKEPNEPSHRVELADAHMSLAWNYMVVGTANKARPHCQTGVELLAKLSEDFPKESIYRHKLAQAREKFGMLLRSHDKTGAQEQFEKAIELEQALVAASPDNPDYRRAVASSSFYLGFLLVDSDPKSAKAYFTTAELLQRKLAAADPKNPEYRAALAETIANMGTALNALGDGAAAREHFKEGIERQKEVVAQFPSVIKYRIILSGIYGSYAKMLRAMGDVAGAQEQSRQGFAVSNETSLQFPEMATARLAVTVGDEFINPPVAELRASIGKKQTVEFRVQKLGGNTNRYLNSKIAFQEADCFTAVVVPEQAADYDAKYGWRKQGLLGAIIRVTGIVEDRNGRLYLSVDDLDSQLEVVKAAENSATR